MKVLFKLSVFQFLIVRLKYLYDVPKILTPIVSIPYSTIKIIVRFNLCPLLLLFQFLIVRLK